MRKLQELPETIIYIKTLLSRFKIWLIRIISTDILVVPAFSKGFFLRSFLPKRAALTHFYLSKLEKPPKSSRNHWIEADTQCYSQKRVSRYEKIYFHPIFFSFFHTFQSFSIFYVKLFNRSFYIYIFQTKKKKNQCSAEKQYDRPAKTKG